MSRFTLCGLVLFCDDLNPEARLATGTPLDELLRELVMLIEGSLSRAIPSFDASVRVDLFVLDVVEARELRFLSIDVSRRMPFLVFKLGSTARSVTSRGFGVGSAPTSM